MSDLFALSQQQRYWWRQHYPEFSQGAGWIRCILNGTFDETKAIQALDTLVTDHEILRTGFPQKTGMKTALQMIHERAETILVWFDQLTALQKAADAPVAESFPSIDSEVPAKLVLQAFAEASDKTWLQFRLPGTQADPQTLINLAQSWFAIYAGDEAGTNEPLQYADFEAWQVDTLEEDDGEARAGKVYWTKPSQVKASASRPGGSLPTEPGFEPGFQVVDLPSQITTELMALATQTQLDLDDLLLAGFHASLKRLGWQETLFIDWLHPGRKYEDMPEALGPFTTSLPLHHQSSSIDTLLDIAKAINQLRQRANQYQEYIRLEAPAASVACTQILFESFTLPAPVIKHDQAFAVMDLRHSFEKFLFRLSLHKRTDGIGLEVGFNQVTVSSDEADHLTSFLAALLQGACEQPNLAISRLFVNSKRIQDQLVLGFNSVELAEPHHRSVHCQFEDHAQHQPQKTALVFGDNQFSYAQLNQWANQIAHQIQSHPAYPASQSEVTIGVSLPRQPQFIASMLAILKLGAAFVAIDPNLPKDRRSQLQSSAGVALILGENAAHPAAGLEVTATPPPANTRFANPSLITTLDQSAYILFTSGSTGTPKGVVISHRNLAAYVAGICQRLGFNAGENFALVATLYADLGFTCLFPALCQGKVLHLISERDRVHPGAFAEYCQQNHMDYLKITPSHLAALLAHQKPELILPKHALILGGESPNQSLLETIGGLAPNLDLFNHYGPTETTIGVMTDPIGLDQQPPALGRPLAGVQVYLLDSAANPVGPGALGEICIAGATVSRGYLCQPQPTAAAFRPNPFAQDPAGRDSRIYHTGDQAYFNAQHQLVFSGRKDDQIKIRGFRIELAEINHALLNHAEISDALTLIHQKDSPQPQILAYIRGSAELTCEDAESFLEARLPAYMQPHHTIKLTHFPLNANGKVDRKALPTPQSLAAQGQAKPTTKTEHILCDIFQNVLKMKSIGIHDNFFRLGGDSIQCILVVAQAEEDGLHFTVEKMFRHQTIAKLAANIEPLDSNQISDQPQTALFDFNSDERETLHKTVADLEDFFPLAPVQKGLLFHSLYERESRAYLEQKMVRFNGHLDMASFPKAWAFILARHPALGAGFNWETFDQPIQFTARHTSIPLATHDWQHLSQTEQDSALDAFLKTDREAGFNLAKPPLMRLCLFQLASASWLFLWTHHHLILDGWSLPIILKDWKAAYIAFKADTPLTLKPAPAYRNFIGWLASQDKQRPEQLWRNTLAGFQTPTYLKEPGEDQTISLSDTYQYQHLQIPLEQVSLVESWLRQETLTMNTLLQLAWSLTLAQTLQVQDLVFGTTVSGRPPNLERVTEMVGLFINTMPVRFTLAAEKNLLAMAHSHQEKQVELREFCHLSLVQIGKWSELEAGQALFDHLLIFENVPEAKEALQNQSLGDLTMALLDFKAIEKTNYSLILKILPNQSLNLEIMYDPKLIAPQKIKRSLKRFAFYLSAIPKYYDQTGVQIIQACTDFEKSRSQQQPSKRFQAKKARVTT